MTRSAPLARRALPLVLALALLVAGFLTTPRAASAAAPSRLAGPDRYATAVAVSRSHFAPGVPVAYVVTGANFPDALAAGPAAAAQRGPVLLVERTSVPAVTADELQRLEPASIVVVGGTDSVSVDVARRLEQYTSGPVERVEGVDRVATAVEVSRGAFGSATTVFVANGGRFPDALAATPAAHANRAPLLLVGTSSVPATTAEEIRRLGAGRVVILGGTAVVDASAEAQLRSLVPDVSRLAGPDRTATSVAVSSRTFAPGVPVAHLATAGFWADALAGGPVAALSGGPVLLVGANCVPRWVDDELRRLRPGRIVLLGGPAALGRGVEDRTICPWPGATARTPTVTPAAAPAFDDDAPDPAILRVGSTWYAYTTGTTWGNNLGVLTSSDPAGGWRTVTGKPYGSTALAEVPSWQVPGTQWAPGVYDWRGTYVMFYAAQARAHGLWCLSAATADTPAGPFRDRTSGPIVCQVSLGGSIDPHPFVDADGRPWLHWKNNDGSSAAVSRVWAAPLAQDGVTLAGAAVEVLAKDTSRYPWQTTVDNPQMVLAGGVHYLFHTGGDYEGNDTYAVGYAVCAGPTGPCTTARDPILRSYGSVAGPGGGTVERDASGAWWISYHAWEAGCTTYACGGKRRLYVAPLGWS